MSVNAATFQMRPNAQGRGVPRELWTGADELTALGIVTGAPVVGNPVLANLAPEWNLPATINIPQSDSVGVRQYLVNGAGLTISVTNLPTGVTYNSGTESLEGAASGTSSGTATFTAGSAVDTATVALVEAVAYNPGNPLLFDDFNYQADASNISSESHPYNTVGPWTGMKSDLVPGNWPENGSITNVTKAQFEANTGNTDPWPGSPSAYSLRLAAQNREGGTDFYLQYGDGTSADNDIIPANVYFQFWIYMNRYGDEITAVQSRHKFLYPSNQAGGSSSSNKWLFSFAADPGPMLVVFPDPGFPYGNPSTGGAFPVLFDYSVGTINNTNVGSDVSTWFGPSRSDTTLNDLAGSTIPYNEWVCLRVHIDTSDNNSGVYETWMRRQNAAWVKLSEWIGGQSGLIWHSFGAGGHRQLRMPTTIGWTNRDDGAYYYLRDFAMAGSVADLPTYGDEP